jgi:predicted transcriptional regulator
MKNLIFFFSALLGLQACSQSPSGNGSSAASAAEAVVLTTSPNNEFQLLKTESQTNGQTQTTLRVVRLADKKEAVVCNTNQPPKFFWSNQQPYLIAESGTADSINQREVIIFDLNNMSVLKRKQGILLAFDNINEVLLVYRLTPERQVIGVIQMKSPQIETIREIIAVFEEKTPVVIFKAGEREAKIKAYTTGGAAINTAFKY